MNRSILRWVVLGALISAFSVASFGQVAVGISVRIGPPALPVYAQPICPGPGYFWTPGYWAWDDDDGYYWVPGTWVVAPVGLLWTPGYWGWGGGVYLWHAGYWGPHVGFYGGINYGFGYGGVGFGGGEWRGGSFYYNRSVTNVSVTNVTNVYNKTVIVNNNTTTSFNGGSGGVQARPTAQEEAFSRERHTAPLAAQNQHEHAAAANRENFASQNHGRPSVAATARPGDFSRHSAVAARASGGEYHAPQMSPRQARGNAPEVNRGSSSPGNRVNANAANNNKAASNDRFRPFTPPAKNNVGNPRSSQNQAVNSNRGNRGNESRFNESRPQQHPSVPPPHHESAASRPASRPVIEHSSPPPHHESAAPRPASRPVTQHSSPPPHTSPAPHSNPPQQHQAQAQQHHGKG
jgi:hypothetical protein